VSDTNQSTSYSSDAVIQVTCFVCGCKWQMTYGELQHYRVAYRGNNPASASMCDGEEYHITCRNPRHPELVVFCLPVKR